MAIRVTVQNRNQIIVPARIDRAVVGGPPLIDAPDVDDRGWLNNRAAGLNVDDARGALFGIMDDDTVRLRVVREDIDDTAPLFVTAAGGQVSIAAPAGGGPLGADGIFSVLGVVDSTAGTKIQVHLGSETGPVICEADAHVFSPLTFNVTPHVCTIHSSAAATGVAPTVNGAALDATVLNTIFDIVRAIWRPCGVQFNIGPIRQETFNGFLRDDFATFNRPGVGSETNIVIGRRQVANTCNIYFLRVMERFLGLGVRFENRPVVNFTHSGILIAVNGFSTDAAGANQIVRSSNAANIIQEIGNDVAHEIGHFLALNHADNVNGAGLSDTYGRRMLMHPGNLLPTAAATPPTATSMPRFDNIGYGLGNGVRGHRGCLITLKDHPAHSTDGEVITARRRFRNPNVFR